MSSELVTLDDVRCGCGHEYVFPAAIKDGKYAASYCPIDDEEGPTIDNYDLFCGRCRLRISESFGQCPTNPSHELKVLKS